MTGKSTISANAIRILQTPRDGGPQIDTILQFHISSVQDIQTWRSKSKWCGNQSVWRTRRRIKIDQTEPTATIPGIWYPPIKSPQSPLKPSSLWMPQSASFLTTIIMSLDPISTFVNKDDSLASEFKFVLAVGKTFFAIVSITFLVVPLSALGLFFMWTFHWKKIPGQVILATLSVVVGTSPSHTKNGKNDC